MNHIECVVFDWAGTTVDFGSLSPVSAFREAFRAYGVEVTEAETRAPMGMLKIDHIRTMLAMPDVAARFEAAFGRAPTDADAHAVYAKFEPALMAVLDRHSDLKPGLLECVAELRAMGLRIGSTTGFTRKMMDVVEPAAARAGYAPDAVVTAEDVGGKGRPWPFMVFKAMRLLEVASVGAVMKVGDTVSDVKEGLAAGAFTVGITDGSSVMGLSRAEWEALDDASRAQHRERTAQVFRDAGAHAVIRDLTELPALVRQLSGRG